MRIKSINIKNFKSLKDITIPIQSYGEGAYKSNTTFLVGVNESGKSAILEAISLINGGFDEIDYESYCHLESQEKDNNDIHLEVLLDDIAFLQNEIIEQINLDEEFRKKIKIIDVRKYLHKNDVYCYSEYNITINNDLPFYKYIINKEQMTVTTGSKPQTVETIGLLSEINNIEEEITQENARNFLKENQVLLSKEVLEKKLANFLESTLNQNMPKIQIWRPRPQYLINDTIDLEKFKENPNISIPLRNIFFINGKTTNNEIKLSVERALADQARCDELREKMEETTTKYINKIWKEHSIKIKISINATNCKVLIEDKDKKYIYYKMEQRSEGFKQFISLILSLSAQNNSNTLKGNIILIDEPEIHLHPSGIRYMRDEILKIGENNHVFVATHSNYMVDTNVRERHWIVTKEKAETKISQMNEDYNFTDDKVLSAAFGLNIFKELLPPNIIIVEGSDDKEIISHAVHLLDKTFFCSIKGAGGASKIPAFAKLLMEEMIKPFIIFDADNDGNDKKRKILNEQADFYSELNVFTLKDLLPSLPKDATIEDLLPTEFVKAFFDQEMGFDFNMDGNEAIIKKIRKQNTKLNEDKQKLDSLKMKLADSFSSKFKSKKELEEKAPKLASFINELFSRIEDFNKQ